LQVKQSSKTISQKTKHILIESFHYDSLTIINYQKVIISTLLFLTIIVKSK